jgi:hypothetical protein
MIMTCKTKLFLWYLCAGGCIAISVLFDNWIGWFAWIISLLVFFILIAFGVIVYPVSKVGKNTNKSSLPRVLEVLVIIVPAIVITVHLLVGEENITSSFFTIINTWTFPLVVLCLILIVLMHLREEIRMAAKMDEELQSNSNRN